MGQAIGKAGIHPDAIPFVNLPHSLVTLISQSIYEVAEGFSLDKEEVKRIIQISLHEYFSRLSESELDERSEALFAVFNQDASDSKDIDSFEFIATICIVSAMNLEEKIAFFFSLFDFNESGKLTVNEATLAFRTIVSGTCKISSTAEEEAMDVDFIDKVALEAFQLPMPDNLNYSQTMVVEEEDCQLTKDDFFHYVINCAETLSLLSRFDNISAAENAKRGADNTEATKTPHLRFPAPIDQDQVADEPWRDTFGVVREKSRPRPSSIGGSANPPADGLVLHRVYGRNAGTPAMYCSNGDAVYAAGSVVVKVPAEGMVVQEYFMGHLGHVTSIDVFYSTNDGGTVVASADADSEPKICVWSPTTLSLIATIPCTPHPSGISKLKFSPSGKLLITLGNNDSNSVAIYHWKEKHLVFTCKIPGTDVYDFGFLDSDDVFGVCTKDAVFFCTRMNSNVPYAKHRGVFNRLSIQEVMTSIACVGDKIVVTGSLSGRLWIWEGRVCVRMLADSLCSGPITHLHAPGDGEDLLLSVSTQGGLIYLLKGDDLRVHHRLAPNKALRDSDRVIDFICWNPARERVLVGQDGNAVYEVHTTNGNEDIVTAGHFLIQGMTLCNENLVTVGGGRMKMWNSADHNSLLQQISVGAALACVSYNSVQNQIAVGFGTESTRSRMEKSFAIFNADDMRMIHEGCNSLTSLTVCRHSSDGKLVVFGSEDSNVYIHDCKAGGFPLLVKLKGLSSPVSHIDFGCDVGSENAAYLRANSAGGEALFWTTRGKLQTPLSMKDIVWESGSCIYRLSLEHAHNSCHDDHNDRVSSCHPLLNNGKESKSILVGSSSGTLCVHGMPIIAGGTSCIEYRGHSGSIDSILSSECGAIYTMSKKDCLFQWKRQFLDWDRGVPVEPLRNKQSQASPDQDCLDMGDCIDQMENLNFSESSKKKDAIFKARPWTRSVVAPSNFSPNEGTLPDSQLTLERIHGYSGTGVRNNLHHVQLESGNNCILYTVGKTLVRYDIDEDAQEFYMAPSAISCLAVHRGKSIAIGSSPAIVIVDFETMKPQVYLNHPTEFDERLCLDFDDSGRFVVSTGSSCKQTIVVYDCENASAAVASCRSLGLETHDVKFLRGSSHHLVSVGTCFVRVLTIRGCSLVVNGDFKLHSRREEVQFYTCSYVGSSSNDVLVGTSTGEIIRLATVEAEGERKRIKAHTSAVIAISRAPKDGFITSSADGIKQFNSSMRCMLSIRAEDISSHDISSVCWADDSILVGTTGNQIFHLSSDDGSNLDGSGKALMSSHSAAPMGLAAHPCRNGVFSSCGDDGRLRLWNVFDSRQNLEIDLEIPARSCAFSPDSRGLMIAVGFGTPLKKTTAQGKLVVLNAHDTGDFQIICERRDSRQHVTEMKWHSSNRLAVGSADNKIRVYGVATDTKPAIKVDLTLLSTLEPASSPIHFDFSSDGKYLRVNSERDELRFFESGAGLHIKEPSRLKDAQWDTETCIFSWNVHGVWPRGDVLDVVSLDCPLQEDCPSIMSGDSSGCLRVHNFPCTSDCAQYTAYQAHAGPVGKVRCIRGGYVASTGQTDTSIMLWRHSEHLFGEMCNAEIDSRPHSENDTIDNMCHSALYCNTRKVLYPSSGNCVVLDKESNTHEAFHHPATVSAICISNSKQIVASSDNATIRVWDAQTVMQVGVFSHPHHEDVRITRLSFSSNDDKLVSLGTVRNQQLICVWMTPNGFWNDACLHLHTLAGHEKVNFCHFVDVFDDVDSTHLICGGRNHITFWSEKHLTLVASKRVVNDTLLSCAQMVNRQIITGTSSGSFIVWKGKQIVKEVQAAHNSKMLSLRASPQGFVSGCSEGVVTLWSTDLQKIASYALTSDGIVSVCSLDVIPHTSEQTTSKILVLTQAGEMMEISCVTGTVYPLTKIIPRYDAIAPEEEVTGG